MSAAQEVIPAAVVQAQKAEQRKLIPRFAERYGVDANKLLDTLKATAFKQRQGEVSNEQMMALLVVADQYHLNPFTKEIYAYPDKNNGIVPVVGLDGWSRIINEHPQFDGMDFIRSETTVTPDMGKPCPEWIECVMHRKDRSHPTVVREDLDEVYRPPFMKDNRPVNGPWQTHTKRMLRHKSVIQAARLAFGFVGIFDPDEAERIIAAEPIDITPRDDLEVPEGTKEKRIGHAKLRDTVEKITKYTENKDGDSLMRLWGEFDNEQKLYVWGFLLPWVRTAFRQIEAVAIKANGFGDLPSFSIELLKSCKNAAELDAAWRKVQDAFTEADQEIPDNVATTCDEMRSSMGAV